MNSEAPKRIQSAAEASPKKVKTVWGEMTEDELHALQDQLFEDDEE